MPRTRPARLRPLRLLAIVVFGLGLPLGGCDLMAAPSPPRPSRLVATPEPPPETAPVESEEAPTLRPEPTGDGVDLVDAANRLADVASYRVAVKSRGLVPASTTNGQVAMTSTLVQGTDPAAEFTMTGVAGFPGGRLDAVVIADEAWLREGGDIWRKSPGGAADFDAAFTTLSPIDLLTGFDGVAAALAETGEELKNGQRATHFRSEDGDARAVEAGLTRGTTDVWLTVDDGRLVAFALAGTWDLEGVATPVTLTIDVTHVNDRANVVRAPAA
jgi:hypothetical protein